MEDQSKLGFMGKYGKLLANPYGSISASRRVVVSSLHPYDSCPSHDDVGRFFFEFEAVRTNRDAPRRCSGWSPRRRGWSTLEG